MSRALEASLVRADGGAVSSAPPARWIRGTKEEVARTLARLSVEEARADYGLVGGIFSPAALLATPTLYRYAGQLRAAGLRVADTDADANVEGEESDAEADGADGADGAGCGCEDVTWRLRELASEIACEIKAEDGGGGGAQQEALQLALAVAARHGHAALARRALDLGADPAPRPAAKRRGAVATISGGLPALHEACAAGHARIAAMLLDAKARRDCAEIAPRLRRAPCRGPRRRDCAEVPAERRATPAGLGHVAQRGRGAASARGGGGGRCGGDRAPRCEGRAVEDARRPQAVQCPPWRWRFEPP